VLHRVITPAIAALGIAWAVGAAATPAQALEVAYPKYRVELVKFKALDESGWDGDYYWPWSDEPYWVVSASPTSLRSAPVTYKTQTFSDVDSGESRTFGGADRCVYPRDCTSATAPNGIGLSVQLIEEDSTWWSSVVSKYASAFTDPACEALKQPQYIIPCKALMYEATKYVSQWLKDDPIDSKTFFYTKEWLAKYVPNVGSSFTEVRHFGSNPDFASGDADYDLTLRVTRVA
jgi:hypothetical protein